MVRYAALKRRLHFPPPVQPPDYSKNAAQYIRMSTDQQVGSPINQRDAIALFAEQRGLAIVRTYIDEGCSGLSIEGRPELLSLIDEISSGRAEFRTVLVYDVSILRVPVPQGRDQGGVLHRTLRQRCQPFVGHHQEHHGRRVQPRALRQGQATSTSWRGMRYLCIAAARGRVSPKARTSTTCGGDCGR
jgi:hypothetical protein